MAFKLPGLFIEVQITDLGVQDGTPSTGSQPVVLTALVKNSIEVGGTMDEVDMTAITDGLSYTQTTHRKDEASLEFFVPETGAQLKGLLGHYVKLEWKEEATLAFNELDGVCTAHKWSASDAQAETITIKGGAN